MAKGVTKAGQSAANAVDKVTKGKVSLKAFVAELFGTALFVYSAIATATTNSGSLEWNYDKSKETTTESALARFRKDVQINGSWSLSTAFSFGIGVMVMAYAVGGISGAHLNPAVTAGQWLTGHMNWLNAVSYMVAQIVGAIFAAGLLYGTIPGASNSALGALTLNPGVGPWYAVLGESVMTTILVFTVLMTVNSKTRLDSNMAPLAIGFAVFLGHLVLIPIDGCSINPARALGPAIVAGVWPGTFWIYIVGPFFGSIFGSALFYVLNSDLLGTARDLESTEGVTLGQDAPVKVAAAAAAAVEAATDAAEV